MKMKANTYVLIAIIIIMLAVVGSAFAMPDFKEKLLPIVFGSGVTVLAVIQLVRESSAKGKPKTAATADEDDEAGEIITWQGFLKNGVWVAVFVLVTFLIGMVVAIPTFVLFYMKSLGAKWLTSVFYAIISTALIWFIFEFALNVQLHRGLIFEWVG